MFCFNLINNIIAALCAKQCLQYAEQSGNLLSLHSVSVTKRLEMGLKVYDTFCLIQLRGLKTNATFDALLILEMGYAILMFNAAATITAWGVLPAELVWATPVLTLLCVFMMIAVLPYTVECCRYSERLLRKWMLLARQSRSSMYIRKKLASRLPVGFIFGSFRPINHEFRLVYFESVLERSSNQILVYKGGGTFQF